jgi:hypothetical protein
MNADPPSFLCQRESMQVVAVSSGRLLDAHLHEPDGAGYGFAEMAWQSLPIPGWRPRTLAIHGRLEGELLRLSAGFCS